MLVPLLAALTLHPCGLRGIPNAQCGTLAVSNTVALNIVRVPSGKKHDDALFVIAGGPGVGATNMTAWATRSFGAGERDIVLVDARGTGKSHPLHCDSGDALFSDLMAPDVVAACRDKLKADFAQFTTRHVVEDLEAVRKALGYKSVTLYGTSYGTRVAQTYMRRHPESVRAVILDGVVPPSFAMPSRYAENAQRSVQRIFAMCKQDAKCSEAYPNLEDDLTAMLKDAEDGVVIDGATMRRGFFGEAFRNFLYSPEQYTRLPFVVHSAANGDWAPFGRMATQYSKAIRALDLGFFLSVTCAEDIPRVDEAAVRAAGKGTILGSYRLDQQLGACKVWPHGTADAKSSEPVRSSIPTLIVSGELDPVTPPEYGDEVARTLKHAFHLVIPAGSHSGETGGCVEKVISEFIREGSVDALDTACVKSIERPPFFIAVQRP